MSNQKKMFISMHNLLIEDEKLLRLLYYPPTNLRNEQPNPLSDDLENILDREDVWDIRDKHILLTSKSDDLVESEICRIYVYPGKIRPSLKNFTTMKQELVVDIFCHYRYERDLRMMSITDRLSDLLFNERIHGLGKIDYRNGYDFNSPKGYQAYRHIYEIGGTK